SEPGSAGARSRRQHGLQVDDRVVGMNDALWIFGHDGAAEISLAILIGVDEGLAVHANHALLMLRAKGGGEISIHQRLGSGVFTPGFENVLIAIYFDDRSQQRISILPHAGGGVLTSEEECLIRGVVHR